MKYTLSNWKKLYIFENADVKSKKTHKTISKNYLLINSWSVYIVRTSTSRLSFNVHLHC